MPPNRTQVNCPRCHQPTVAQIEQLFDVTADPGAKQRLLGGISNRMACPHCGYAGMLATPIVYHDADNELLLTHFPGELGVPVNEQEKLIGPLINQVVNRLPADKRKAYLLQPQGFLTFQSLIERILGVDGITPEMIKAQQEKITLIENLLAAKTTKERSEIIKKESQKLDGEFFNLFTRLLETTIASGQENTAQEMSKLQEQLFTETEYGKKLQSQVNEIQAAVKTLQDAGKELTRERLVDILIEAPNNERLSALVSLTRPALDYLFFQALSERIETKSGDERLKLEDLRNRLLELTRQIDQRVEEEYKRAGEMLNSLLAAENIQEATIARLNQVTDIFLQVLNRALEEAKKKKDDGQIKKLDQITSVIQNATAPPPELGLLEELVNAPDENALTKLLNEHEKEISPEFIQFVSNVLVQSENRAGEKPKAEDQQIIQKLDAIYRAALKISMKKSLKQ